MNTQPKKRGRPVGSKNTLKFHNLEKGHKDIVTFNPKDYEKDLIEKELNNTQKLVGSKKAILLPEYPEVAKFITAKIKEEIRIDKALEDLEIPTRKELGMHRGNNKMSLPNKITLVLTVVNVLILGYLIIKNLN